MSSGWITGRALLGVAVMSVAYTGAFSPSSLSAASAAELSSHQPLHAASHDTVLLAASRRIAAEERAVVEAIDRLEKSGAMGLSGRL
ncbi:MAG TPA: hypothetical protein VKZ41_03400, partial [Gemmatimonadales bacterium]|nr:hypothetical protein [Gemmatimonadales bacterium]